MFLICSRFDRDISLLRSMQTKCYQTDTEEYCRLSLSQNITSIFTDFLCICSLPTRRSHLEDHFQLISYRLMIITNLTLWKSWYTLFDVLDHETKRFTSWKSENNISNKIKSIWLVLLILHDEIKTYGYVTFGYNQLTYYDILRDVHVH